jgi:hypothetical protein
MDENVGESYFTHFLPKCLEIPGICAEAIFYSAGNRKFRSEQITRIFMCTEKSELTKHEVEHISCSEFLTPI